ncbi:MAG: ROK family transcriptional regulator, partial [Spirochaetes bacterium]|nr:ROK family transcriptional regulator [Spirochaetota bacterium]
MRTSTTPLRATDIRERNEKIVLRHIRNSQEQGLSQSEVVQKTGLKAPTVFRIYSRLETLGLIEPLLAKGEAGEKLERKGRRPAAYRIRPQALYMIGLDFWAESLTLGIFDLCGDSVLSENLSLDSDIDAEAVCDLIANTITSAIKRLKIRREKILGVGVGAPGQVNVKTREISFYSRIKGMTNFPIATKLEAALKLPVTLNNNCAVLALSEFRYTIRQTDKSLFMFILRAGVNGAFINADSIFTTARATTIETGHITIKVDGPVCPCGAKGCLEKMLTELDQNESQHGGWLFSDLVRDNLPEESSTPQAGKTLDQAAEYLSAA